jgi:hypothetical protein
MGGGSAVASARDGPSAGNDRLAGVADMTES